MDVESTEAVKEKKARGRQHASSVHNEDEGDVNLLPPRGEGSQGRVGSLVKGESQEPSLLKNSRNNGNVSSQKSFGTDGPLNTYAEFKNVFNAKGVGTKTHRRQAQQAQNSLQD